LTPDQWSGLTIPELEEMLHGWRARQKEHLEALAALAVWFLSALPAAVGAGFSGDKKTLAHFDPRMLRESLPKWYVNDGG